MIELETMLMQFCLETSGRRLRRPVSGGFGEWAGIANRRIILWQRPAETRQAVTVLHGLLFC